MALGHLWKHWVQAEHPVLCYVKGSRPCHEPCHGRRKCVESRRKTLDPSTVESRDTHPKNFKTNVSLEYQGCVFRGGYPDSSSVSRVRVGRSTGRRSLFVGVGVPSGVRGSTRTTRDVPTHGLHGFGPSF